MTAVEADDVVAPDADLALELKCVRAAYGTIDVLRGVDLQVPYGGVVALLGPNGGGKSTTLRVVAGQLAATEGDVMVAGRRVNGAPADELARRGVCLVPEGRGIFPNLSVRENLWMTTYRGVSRSEAEHIAFDRFPNLAARRRQLAGTLSGGEQQMLALARALCTNPALLLLDELSMGLAPIIVEQLYEIVAQIAREGVALVVVEQFAQAVMGISDLVGIMLRGRVVALDRPDVLEPELAKVYLGE
ncbi:MAG TPA: ABC transporter ATP-binding protein [Acidimicrobiia bacterium]|jgi:branched-chain amino acid transport system ATP-binding protein